MVARTRLPAGRTAHARAGSPCGGCRRATRRRRVRVAGALAGLRVGGRRSPAGADLSPRCVGDAGPARRPARPSRPGERVAEVVAAGAAASSSRPAPASTCSSRARRGDGAPGRTTLALEDVEVARGRAGARRRPTTTARAARRRLAARDLRQAVYLAAAQAFARELRLLPRAPGDRSDAPRCGSAVVSEDGDVGFPSTVGTSRLKSWTLRPIAEQAMRLPVVRLLLSVCALLA